MTEIFDTTINIFHQFFSFLIIISVLVFVHELGHYLFARFYGVRVNSFSIGMGKEFVGFFDKEGTRWKLSYIPIGGYVSLFGHNEFLSNSKYSPNKLTEVEKSYAFDFKPVYQRCLIVLAGPLFNYLFAILILAGIFYFNGELSIPAKVGKVIEHSPAQKIGLKPGDIILSVDGKPMEKFDDVADALSTKIDESVDLEIKRDSKILNFTAKPDVEKRKDPVGYEYKRARLGITDSGFEIKKVGFITSFKLACKEVYKLTTTGLLILKQIIFGKREFSEMGGPIRIMEYSGATLKMGFLSTLWFMAMLSVSLGFFNLLPIPVLDGGYIVIYLLEALIGRSAAESINKVAIKFGMAIIAFVTVITIYNDIIFKLNK